MPLTLTETETCIETDKYSNYLILKLGYINYSDVLILKKRLDLLNHNFIGLVILS